MIFTKNFYALVKVLYDTYPEPIAITPLMEKVKEIAGRQRLITLRLFLHYLEDLGFVKKFSRKYVLTTEGHMVLKHLLEKPKLNRYIVPYQPVMAGITYWFQNVVYDNHNNYEHNKTEKALSKNATHNQQ